MPQGKFDFNQLLKKVQDFFKRLLEIIKNLPNTIKDAPQDEQIAYGAIGLGILLLLIGIILIIIK